MNEQLRKAIKQATHIDYRPQGRYIHPADHNTSQAKLLRVIELLVEQRNKWIKSSDFSILNQDIEDDAELIAALEQGEQ
jgi:hypothetical protein